MRQRSPQEKKRLAFAKDHVVLWEWDKAGRKNWPRKKARVNRETRRVDRQNIILATRQIEDAIGPQERKELVNWKQVMSLGERVRAKLALRRELEGRRLKRFWKRPYAPRIHRAPFVHLIQRMMREKTHESSRFAMFIEWHLAFGPHIEPCFSRGVLRQSRWIHAFIADAPEWKIRLRRWVGAELSWLR